MNKTMILSGLVLIIGVFLLSVIITGEVPTKKEVKVFNNTYNYYNKEIITKEVQIKPVMSAQKNCLSIYNKDVNETKIFCKGN